MSNKPSLPQGTRDFGPEVVRKRQYILTTIRTVFERYGFQPLETPAMENLETLMGKYGEEGDKLIFKILNNGLERPEKEQSARAAFDKVLSGKSTRDLTERALRYDLTIPFARFVAMNHGTLTFPFRRYQVQPVWRADKPQRGRYREFYQCDADVVGSRSLMNEVDLCYIYHTVFIQLGLKGYELRINSRKLLAALAEACGGSDKMMDITIAIDKLDKIGLDKVKDELAQRGLDETQIALIEKYLLIDGSNEEKLAAIKALLGDSETGKKGIDEIEFVWSMVNPTPSPSPGGEGSTPPPPGGGREGVNLVLDFTLARGLNYYTGIIFEVKAPAEVKIGSIGGGGRYDDLTGLFGVPDMPGVGISFGVDRIYDVLEELKLFPEAVAQSTRVLFFNLGAAEGQVAYRLLQALRGAGISGELFHESVKMDKQFKYAEKKGIPFIVIIGSRELEQQVAMVKELATGKQESIPFSNLLDYLANK
jgi:histidyl-tRNA synthetase